MAPRIVKIRHDDETRAKIQATQLINRLTDHALGSVELSQTQVRSIEILLKKSLPDLQSVELSTDPDKPLTIQTLKRLIVDPRTKPDDSDSEGIPAAT
jgi:hypothetical protein